MSICITPGPFKDCNILQKEEAPLGCSLDRTVEWRYVALRARLIESLDWDGWTVFCGFVTWFSTVTERSMEEEWWWWWRWPRRSSETDSATIECLFGGILMDNNSQIECEEFIAIVSIWCCFVIITGSLPIKWLCWNICAGIFYRAPTILIHHYQSICRFRSLSWVSDSPIQ